MLCHLKKIKDIYIPYSRKNLFYWFLLGLRHGTSILRFSHQVNFLISILDVHFGATIIINGLRSSKFMVGTCQSQLSVVLSLIWRRQASPSHLTPLSQATHNRVVIVFIFLFIFLIRFRSDHSLTYLKNTVRDIEVAPRYKLLTLLTLLTSWMGGSF